MRDEELVRHLPGARSDRPDGRAPVALVSGQRPGGWGWLPKYAVSRIPMIAKKPTERRQYRPNPMADTMKTSAYRSKTWSTKAPRTLVLRNNFATRPSSASRYEDTRRRTIANTNGTVSPR